MRWNQKIRIMKLEDKQLLLQDLCGRLPYGVMIQIPELFSGRKNIEKLVSINDLWHFNDSGMYIEYVKPYLRPMSSMTEEEYDEMFQQLYSAQEEFFRNCSNTDTIGKTITYDLVRYDWLNKKMFDFRGLIPKGLGISTEVFNPYAED